MFLSELGPLKDVSWKVARLKGLSLTLVKIHTLGKNGGGGQYGKEKAPQEIPNHSPLTSERFRLCGCQPTHRQRK